MAKITITVALDVDIAEFGAEYGLRMTTPEVREHLATDLTEALRAAPYADALKNIKAK